MGRIKRLDLTQIKTLALLLMLADHIYQMFNSMGAPVWLTIIGRPVFPLFLFALAEGFYHTRDRKKYLLRLLLASWLMTLTSALLQYILPNDNVVLMNNAFSTLLITGLYIVFWDRFVDGVREFNFIKIISSILFFALPVISAYPALYIVQHTGDYPLQMIRIFLTLSLLIPNIILVEGGFIMVLLGLGFYILRKHGLLQIAMLLALSYLVYYMGNEIQAYMALAALPIFLYNGKKGRGMRNFFYVFYPAHIFILYIIASLI